MDSSFILILLTVFYVATACVGLPCLIWAFCSVHRQRKAKGRISAFIILLLLSDLFQLLLYPCIVSTLYLSSLFSYFIIVVSVCLKLCSLHLQQVVALEGVLTLKYPTVSARMFSNPCYIMISIIILIIPLMCSLLLDLKNVLYFNYVSHGYAVEILTFGSFLACVCLLVVTGIIVCKAPPTAASTPVTDKPGVKVFTVSLVTLVVLYLPFVLLLCKQIFLLPISQSWVITLCLISLTVISEPLLCVLVCRENLSAQTKRTQIELISVHTLV